MKTTDPRDSLDRKIDELLANRPLKPSTDFTAQVLAAADELPLPKRRRSPMAQIVRFALPIAALVAVAFTVAQFKFNTTPPATVAAATLSTAEMQEIFILEEGLTGLTQLKSDTLDNSTNLLSTLDAIYFDI
jgi:hypothetical protein